MGPVRGRAPAGPSGGSRPDAGPWEGCFVAVPELSDRQDRQWSRQAAKYDDLFLDPFRPGVENPLPDAIRAIPDPASKAVADLGCGTGPLIPLLAGRFGEVVALDFAPKMVEVA